MGFFNNKNNEENAAPRNPSNVVMFRVLAVGYVAYLCFQMIQTYLEGGSDAPSLPMLIGGVAILGAGAIFLAIVSVKEYKRSKASYDAYMAELREEAEAKRAAEEALEAAQAEEDAYYDALEEAEEDEA